MRRAWIGLTALSVAACSIDADLSNKRCPCAVDFVCDTARDLCVSQREATDASIADSGDAGLEEDSGAPADTGVEDAAVSDDAGFEDSGPSMLTFTDDEFVGEFELGTFTDTIWAGNRLTLAPGVLAGEYESRTFDAVAVAEWQTIALLNRAPYGKPLPDDRQAESGYAEGNADMADAVLLMHFDLDFSLAPGEPVLDTSGRDNHGQTMGVGSLVPAPGRFGPAAQMGADAYVAVEVSSGSDLEFEQGDFSWTLWVRTTEDCSGNKVHMGIEDGGQGTHLWMGCSDPNGSACPPGVAAGRGGGTFLSTRSGGADSISFCGTTRLNDGNWHHIAVTKRGHANAFVRFYVDGRLEASQTGTFREPFVFSGTKEFTVGAFSTGTYQAAGSFDEGSVFLRELTPDEILNHYLRGALRLSVQVRECSSGGGCSAFVGPNADTQAGYRDPAVALVPGSPISLDGLLGAPRFQYRLRLETDSSTFAPSLQMVTITAER